MPNKMSAKKRVRQTRVRVVWNKARKTQLKSSVRTFQNTLAADKNDAALNALNKAMALLDSNARKRVIHPNKAARIKSRLMRAMNRAKTPKA